MAKVLVNETNLTNIANAIREKNGTTDTYKPSEMATAISNIQAGGGSENELVITNAAYLFYGGARKDQLQGLVDLCKGVTSCSNMFRGVYLKDGDVDLSKFDTSQCTDMTAMFHANSYITKLSLTGFDVSKVKDMTQTFYYCNRLTELDLSTWETSSLTTIKEIFYVCSALTKLDIRNFDFTKVTSYSKAFTSVPDTCEIIVKDDTARTWITSKFTNLTNVKTVAEL